MELRIAGLSKTYPNGVKALDNVSLTIAEGMYGLLGPNGAGKSTLMMRTLATLQAPDSGSAFLDDIDMLRRQDEVRRLLGYSGSRRTSVCCGADSAHKFEADDQGNETEVPVNDWLEIGALAAPEKGKK